IIIAKVSRSRRTCTNSLARMAMKRCQANMASGLLRPVAERRVARRAAHQVDEDVLESRRDFGHAQALAARDRLERALERRRVGAAYVERIAERHHHLDARQRAQLLRRLDQVRAFDGPGREPSLLDHLACGAAREELP